MIASWAARHPAVRQLPLQGTEPPAAAQPAVRLGREGPAGGGSWKSHSFAIAVSRCRGPFAVRLRPLAVRRHGDAADGRRAVLFGIF